MSEKKTYAVIPYGKPTPKREPKIRKLSDYDGKIGPSVTTHERLKELGDAKRSVFIFGRPLPVSVVVNLQYGQICHFLERGYIKEYDPKGGFKP